VSEKCEPPEELRGMDGWHWCALFGHTEPAPERWIAERQMWWDLGATYAAPSIAAAAGYRYLCPVLTPAEADALRAERDDWQQAAQVEADRVNAIRARVAVLEADALLMAQALTGQTPDCNTQDGWQCTATQASIDAAIGRSLALSTGSETPAGTRSEP
jgi:hypothetical protein